MADEAQRAAGGALAAPRGGRARRLRADDLDPDEATRLAGECAELASQAAVELDRLARGRRRTPVPGQEELL